jgi:hypothetical protein
MGRKRQESRGKKIKPHFWVFCEGKTEEAYVCFLRSKYRISIDIVPKIAGSNIDERFINRYKKGKPTHKKDIDFLMYDADVSEVLERLKNIKTATLLASNPSIEFWFLLHYKNQVANISTNDCIKELSNRNNNNYKKGIIDYKLNEKLNKKSADACKRAKQLQTFNNPSSNMHKIIKILENIKKEEKS